MRLPLNNQIEGTSAKPKTRADTCKKRQRHLCTEAQGLEKFSDLSSDVEYFGPHQTASKALVRRVLNAARPVDEGHDPVPENDHETEPNHKS